jgi:hypothetical protein
MALIWSIEYERERRVLKSNLPCNCKNSHIDAFCEKLINCFNFKVLEVCNSSSDLEES